MATSDQTRLLKSSDELRQSLNRSAGLDQLTSRATQFDWLINRGIELGQPMNRAPQFDWLMNCGAELDQLMAGCTQFDWLMDRAADLDQLMNSDSELDRMINAGDQLRRLTTADILGETVNARSLPELTSPIGQRGDHLARGFCNHIKKCIEDFEESLDPQHEVGIRLVSFGQVLTFHLDDIGHRSPVLIFFDGVNERGEPVELIQHINQISVLLIKMPRRNEGDRRKIGFVAK